MSLFSWSWNAKAKEITERKRTERERLIDSAPSYLSSHEQFLQAGAHEIVSRISSGEWTAKEVVSAYISQAASAHRATNCVTEVLFEEALRRADELDAEYASSKQVRPLHGVPFSCKDQFDVEGFDTTIGFTAWAGNPATSDAVLVKQLISLGAIPIVKTNVPQTMFSFECANPLWGRSTNPYNSKFTCGGSSGGEGAILAMDGAAFGIGSDIGGSLRLPSAYCGIYALKTTFGRINRAGARSSNPGYEGIKAVAGPMARTIKDLELFCKLIFGVAEDGHLDYTFIPMPYREPTIPQVLRFGYYTSDDYAKASPACRRAVLETVDALRKQGHECIEIEIPNATDCLEIFLALSSADGYRRLTSPLGPDAMDPSLLLPVYGARLPGFLRAIGAWIVETVLGDKAFAKFARASRVKSVSENIDWADRRNKWSAMFYEKVWNHYHLDGIICPVQAMPQIPNGASTSVNSLVISTAMYNLVDSPIGNIPVTHVDAVKDKLTEEWTSPNSKSTQLSPLMAQRLYQSAKPLYNPDEMNGMPVSIQVVGRKWEDEKVVAMMRIVDEALGPRGFGPRGFANYVKES